MTRGEQSFHTTYPPYQHLQQNLLMCFSLLLELHHALTAHPVANQLTYLSSTIKKLPNSLSMELWEV